MEALKRQKFESGLVVELGCGSGILSERVAAAGYSVLGFDISPAIVKLARARVPGGMFHIESIVTAEIPNCAAVTAIGEVFCYLFDKRSGLERARQMFRKIYRALLPGGVFLFDVAGPGRVPGNEPRRSYTEGSDWACLFTAEEDKQRKLLTRTITTFRKVGDSYRRSSELHRLRLYEPAEIRAELKNVGFRPRLLRGYGAFRFPAGWRGFLATKPRR